MHPSNYRVRFLHPLIHLKVEIISALALTLFIACAAFLLTAYKST
jgi:hypothetical protein